MDVDASERRKIKIYAGKKNTTKKFFPMTMLNWKTEVEIWEHDKFYL